MAVGHVGADHEEDVGVVEVLIGAGWAVGAEGLLVADLFGVEATRPGVVRVLVDERVGHEFGPTFRRDPPHGRKNRTWVGSAHSAPGRTVAATLLTSPLPAL